MALITEWTQVGNGGIARLAGVKQNWEIIILPDTPAISPAFFRRRVTYVSFQIEVNYLNNLPLSGTDPWTWLEKNTGKDYLDNLSWVEPGQDTTATPKVIPPFDNDGKGLPTSGKWLVDGKEIQGFTNGSLTVVVTFRNEGAYINDGAR
jgi:hypothetical protein